MSGLRKPSLSPSTKEAIIRDHFDNMMTSYALGKKYGISDVTAMKVIRELPADFKNHPSPVIEPLVLRTGMSVAEQTKAISELAMNVVELSLQAMLQILTDHYEKLNPSQLALFMSAAAPYVMAKAENRKSDEKQTMSGVFKMFKDNLESNGN